MVCVEGVSIESFLKTSPALAVLLSFAHASSLSLSLARSRSLSISRSLARSLSLSVCLSLSVSLSVSHSHTLSLSGSLSPSRTLSPALPCEEEKHERLLSLARALSCPRAGALSCTFSHSRAPDLASVHL